MCQACVIVLRRDASEGGCCEGREDIEETLTFYQENGLAGDPDATKPCTALTRIGDTPNESAKDSGPYHVLASLRGKSGQLQSPLRTDTGQQHLADTCHI